MSLGTKLKDLRIKKGLTTREVSKIFNLGKSTISNYENDARKPDYDTLNKLASFYEESIDYLIGNSDELDQIKAMGIFKNSIGNRTAKEYAEYLYKATGQEVYIPYIQDVLNGERKINKSLLMLIEEAENPVKQEKKQITVCEKCETYLPLIKKIEDNNIELSEVDKYVEFLISKKG